MTVQLFHNDEMDIADGDDGCDDHGDYEGK